MTEVKSCQYMDREGTVCNLPIGKNGKCPKPAHKEGAGYEMCPECKTAPRMLKSLSPVCPACTKGKKKTTSSAPRLETLQESKEEEPVAPPPTPADSLAAEKAMFGNIRGLLTNLVKQLNDLQKLRAAQATSA